MATVVASAAAAEHLPLPLDGRKPAAQQKDRGAEQEQSRTPRKHALSESATATETVPAASKTSARRAPRNAGQTAAASDATTEPPAQRPKRARPRPAPTEVPQTTTQERSASGRKYPTLARAAVAPVPEAEADQGATHGETADRKNAGRSNQKRTPPAPVSAPMQRQDVVEQARASASPAASAPRVPRPTVALRRSPATKRLSADDLLAEREELPSANAAPLSAPHRLRRLPDVELVVLVAGVHAAVATGAALIGAALLIAGQSGAFWLLALAAIVGVGGWLGYVLDMHRHIQWAAGYALLASHLGVLGWLLALTGPRAAVLMLAPMPLLLALRTGGRVAAIVAAAGALALYATSLALALISGWQPEIATTAGAAVLLDGVLVSAGLLGTLAGAVAMRKRQAGAEAAARARLYELRALRARTTELRQQTEDDADTLARALAEALRGKGIEPIRMRGALSPLTEPVMAVTERLATLQQDREERVRMDAALRAVIREVERAWLGLPWIWPRASGTALDELVALLRAPRPDDAQAVWPHETPTLLTLPTIDTAPLPRVSLPGTTSRPSAPDLARFQTRAPALPWSEWDEWRGWKPAQERDRA